MVCSPLGLAVTVPQAYALVGVAGMLASVCQVRTSSCLEAGIMLCRHVLRGSSTLPAVLPLPKHA